MNVTKHSRRDLVQQMNNMLSRTVPRERLILTTERRKPNSTKNVTQFDINSETSNESTNTGRRISKYASHKRIFRPGTAKFSLRLNDYVNSSKNGSTKASEYTKTWTPDNSMAGSCPEYMKKSSFCSAAKQTNNKTNMESSIVLSVEKRCKNNTKPPKPTNFYKNDIETKISRESEQKKLEDLEDEDSVSVASTPSPQMAKPEPNAANQRRPRKRIESSKQVRKFLLSQPKYKKKVLAMIYSKNYEENSVMKQRNRSNTIEKFSTIKIEDQTNASYLPNISKACQNTEKVSFGTIIENRMINKYKEIMGGKSWFNNQSN